MKKTLLMCLAAIASVFALNSCEDVPEPFKVPGDNGGNTETPVEPAGNGTEADPYNVAKALQVIKSMEADVNSDEMFVKGTITSIKADDFAPNFGNLTYYISDTEGGSTTLYIFRSLSFNSQKFTSADQLKVGDEVVIGGQFVNYKGNTPETVTNRSRLISVNGKTSFDGEGGDQPGDNVEPAGDGTAESPYNVAAVLNLVKAMPADQNSTEDIYFKGFITNINESDFKPEFGNVTYSIADTKGGSTTFYVFRSLSFNSQKFTSADQLKVGDEVVICGKVVNYKGNTPETVTNQSHLISVNGKTEFDNSGETPGGGDEPDQPASPGITVSGNIITLGAEGVTPGTETYLVDLNTKGYANAQDVTEVKDGGCTIVFSAGENTTNAPKFYTGTKGVRMYANNVVTFTADKTIASITITCDTYNNVDQVGNATRTLDVNSNVFTLTNKHTETKGGVQMRIKTVKFTFAE